MNTTLKPTAAPARVTLKDIAARANVSINTASVVLNPRRNQVVVHPETRARVEHVARELGYRRNLAASRLAGGAANTLGILTDRMTNYFHSMLLDAFEGEATRNGFQCVLGCTEPFDAHKMESLRGLSQHGVDGLVLVPVWESPLVGKAMPGLLSDTLPVVFIDYRYAQHPGALVCCDHRAGSRDLAQHLVDKGHRRVTYLHLGAQATAWSINERIEGARDTLNAAGAALDVLTLRSGEPDVLAAGVREALHADAPPTAIMCANDHVAFSLIAGLNRTGLNILGKLAVTGFDDVGYFLPELLEFPRDLPFPWELPLTTVRQPVAAIGKRAAEVLIAALRGHRLPPGSNVLIPGELVARQSTAHHV